MSVTALRPLHSRYSKIKLKRNFQNYLIKKRTDFSCVVKHKKCLVEITLKIAGKFDRNMIEAL